MHIERTINEPRLQLPPDLLSEVARRGTSRRTDMLVSGWKPSFFDRLIALVTGRRDLRG